jgi:hypothetical protein
MQGGVMAWFTREKRTTIGEIADALAQLALNEVSDEALKPFRSLVDPAETGFNVQQTTEILVLAMFSTTRAVLNIPAEQVDRQTLLDAFHASLYREWAASVGGDEAFERLLKERYSSYYESLKNSEEWWTIGLGETFTEAFTGRKIEGRDLPLMMASGETLLAGIRLRTEFLQSVLSTHRLVA